MNDKTHSTTEHLQPQRVGKPTNPGRRGLVARVTSMAAGSLSLLGFSGSTSATSSVIANDAVIRQKLTQRIPGLPAIDQISKTEIPGIFEVRVGNEIAYTDAAGEYLIRGSILRTKDRVDMTAARQEALMRLSFDSLPLSGAFMKKTGNGSRKIAVFADPNCSYCKKFEKDIAQAKDLTVYTILMPLLSQDSADKSQAIWCSKDRQGAWDDWMIKGKAPSKAAAGCSSPLASNLEFAKMHGITGTPTIFFEDGGRVTGAMPLADLNARLLQVKK